MDLGGDVMAKGDGIAAQPAAGIRIKIGPNETPADLVEVVSDTEVIGVYMGGGGLGPQDVEVTTSAGSATAAGAFFAEQPPRPPTITEVEPARGLGGQRVRIRGSGFTQ